MTSIITEERKIQKRSKEHIVYADYMFFTKEVGFPEKISNLDGFGAKPF